MKVSLFIKNTVILSVYGVILRLVGMVFRIFMVNKIGSECTGLYQLIFSVYMLLSSAVNVSLTTAVTRLVSEHSVTSSKRQIRKIVRLATLGAVVIMTIVAVCGFMMSGVIAKIIGDMRALQSVKILVWSLPFMSISACLKGYFSAVKNTISPSNAQVFEQIIRIFVVGGLLIFFPTQNLSLCCAYILLGDTIAEILSCGLLYLLYNSDIKKRVFKGNDDVRGVSKELIRIGLPIGANRFATSSLRTVENLLIPSALTKFSGSSTVALSSFGLVRGMALPIILFPSSILGSVSQLLVPELAIATASKNNLKIKSSVEKVLSITIYFSIFFGFVFHLCSGELGRIIYHSDEVGVILKLLCPVVPMMYLEFVCDGILKGLDQQLHTFFYSLSDCILRILGIYYFVGKYGLYGFMGVMIFSNIFSSSLCLHRILRIVKPKIDITNCIVKPILVGLAFDFTAVFASQFFVGDIICCVVKLIILTFGYLIFTKSTISEKI